MHKFYGMANLINFKVFFKKVLKNLIKKFTLWIKLIKWHINL